MKKFPPIYFYIPPRYWPGTIPTCADDNWQGFGIGIHAWTVQTYLRLKAVNFPCQLVQELPDEGIVLVHRKSLRTYYETLKPRANVLLICLKADSVQYPHAHLHVVQNPLETTTIPNSYYIPHWTQPGLIPRNPQRGDRFETVAFFGRQANLAPEFLQPSWHQQLEALGLHWCPILNPSCWDDYTKIDHRWNDYSEIDAIVAVRSFDPQTLHLNQRYRTKPATKLYNAWLAGVPAILGSESAYRFEGTSGLDYLDVASLAEVISALKRLRDDPELRRTLVENGRVRAQAVQPSMITARWCKFFTDIAIPAYYNWCSQSPLSQQIQLKCNSLIFKANQVKSQVRVTFIKKYSTIF